MLCLSVEVNGEISVVAGNACAETVAASIDLYPSVGESWLRVSGDVVTDDRPSADAKWLGQPLKVGDVVVVRLVESDAPTVPTLSRSDPNAAATDGVGLVCSFCGKNQLEVRKMYAGIKAMICNECLGFMYQMNEQGA
jgi:hypothetical protein